MTDSVAIQVKQILVDVLDIDLNPRDIDNDLSLYSATIGLDSLTLLQVIAADPAGVLLRDRRRSADVGGSRQCGQSGRAGAWPASGSARGRRPDSPGGTGGRQVTGAGK